jgi:hypothetical protein
VSLFKGLTTNRVYNILSIIVILAIITSTVLAIIISALSIGLVLYFSIITSTTNIYYTCKVKVDVYTIRNGYIISCTLAVDIIYSFINIKRGDKLLEVLFLLRILKVNKYLIILILLLNFIVRGIYKGLITSIIIIDYLGTTNNNKARLWSSNYKKVPYCVLDKFLAD